MSGNRRKKGHGCAGFIITLIIAAALILGVLVMTTDVFDTVGNPLDRFLFKKNYTDQVERYSAEFGVEESLVYAVIRTESGFREDVESYAGAIGLMQLMPATFEWLQYKLEGDVIYTADSLKDPDINIRYGTYFLAYLMNRYGDLTTACAAYNAGTTTVDTWLCDSRYSPDGYTLTDIPYPETESYVKKIKDAKSVYERMR